MIHISNPKSYGALCDASLQEGDKLVLAALHSDCDDCRERVMVAPKNQKGCAVKKEPEWVAEPWSKK